MKTQRLNLVIWSSFSIICSLALFSCVNKGRKATTINLTPKPTRTQSTQKRNPTPALGELRSVVLSRDKNSVALGTLGQSSTGQTFGWVLRRDARSGVLLGRWRVPTGVSDLALSPDGSKLATVDNNNVSLWSWPAGKLLRSITLSAAKPMQCDFSPDGQTLAVAYQNLTLFDVATLKPKRALPLPDPPFVNDVTFAPDGHHLTTSHDDIQVSLLLWDLRTRRSRALDASGKAVFSPDGRWLAASQSKWIADSQINRVILFDTPSGHQIKSLKLAAKKLRDAEDEISPLTFSPDSRYLLGYSFHDDKSVLHIWDVRSGKHLKALPHIDGFGVVLWVEARVLLMCSRDKLRRVPLDF